MSDNNRISNSLDAAAVTAIQGAIQTIRANLPFLIGFTPEERRMLPKLGDKSRAFDQKAIGYMEQSPQWVPGYVSMDELRKDRALRDSLEDVLRPLAELCQSVDDTVLQVNSEIWLAELAYYSAVKEAAKRGVAGAQPILDDLGQRFPRGKRAEEVPAPEPQPS